MLCTCRHNRQLTLATKFELDITTETPHPHISPTPVAAPTLLASCPSAAAQPPSTPPVTPCLPNTSSKTSLASHNSDKCCSSHLLFRTHVVSVMNYDTAAYKPCYPCQNCILYFMSLQQLVVRRVGE